MLLSLISSLNDIEFDLALDDPNLDCAVIHDEPGYVPHVPLRTVSSSQFCSWYSREL